MENSKILIVDDQLIGRQLLESVLFKENYELVFAENGKEALEKIKSEQPDVVLLDVMMPYIDGFEVCKRVREDESIKDTPIILITALDDRDSRLNGFQSGANDYISKPIDRLELLARVKNLSQLFRYKKQSIAGLDGGQINMIIETPKEFVEKINHFINQTEEENFQNYFPDFFEFINHEKNPKFSTTFTCEHQGSVHLLFVQCIDKQIFNEISILLGNLFPKSVYSQNKIGLKLAFKGLLDRLGTYLNERYQKSEIKNISMAWIDINRLYHQFKLESYNLEALIFSEDEDSLKVKATNHGSVNSFLNSDKIILFPHNVNGNISLDNLQEKTYSNLDSFISFLTERQEEFMIAGFTLS